MLFVVGAGYALGAQEGTAGDLQADHRELAVAKSEARIAGSFEAEKVVRPIMYAANLLAENSAHDGGSSSRGCVVQANLHITN